MNNAVYVLSTSCCSPEGSTLGHIVKASLNGSALWARDVIGQPSIGRDGNVYSISTPDTGKGSTISALSMQTGDSLWNYTDGTSKFSYIEIGGEQSQLGYLCMPAEINRDGQTNKSVVCLNRSGRLVFSEHITSNALIRFDLFTSAGRFYARVFRDNSYAHSGANQVVELGAEKWSKRFPDDINFVGVVTFSHEAYVVLTRPDCADTPSGLGCRADSLVAFDRNKTRFNVTLPGSGDVTVNPAFPPQFGPFASSNGIVFASSVKKLHRDNTTYDMWYTAVDSSGKIVWQYAIDNIEDLTRTTYAANARGDFYVVFDGVVYKVPGRGSAEFISV